MTEPTTSSDVDMNIVSVVLDGNLGGFPVTLCACGVLCMSSMAHLHAMRCDVFLEEIGQAEIDDAES